MSLPLYPMRFRPVYKVKPWGGHLLATRFGRRDLPSHDWPREGIGESWEVSDVPGAPAADLSVVENGPLAGRSLRDLLREDRDAILGEIPLAGGCFPLLVKYLDARWNLSVQVHPNEAYQAGHPEVHRKTEAWYVLHAEPEAKIYRGLTPETDEAKLRSAVAGNQVVSVLRTIPARAGQLIYLPSGTVHALGAGILLAEVQTPSDTTFRFYDWDRVDDDGAARPLHIEEAIASTDYRPPPAEPEPRALTTPFGAGTRLLACDFFRVDRLQARAGETRRGAVAEMNIWMVLEGDAQLEADGQETLELAGGGTALLPAALGALTVRFARHTTWLVLGVPPG